MKTAVRYGGFYLYVVKLLEDGVKCICRFKVFMPSNKATHSVIFFLKTLRRYPSQKIFHVTPEFRNKYKCVIKRAWLILTNVLF